MKISNLPLAISTFASLTFGYSIKAGVCVDDIVAIANGMGGANDPSFNVTLSAGITNYQPGQTYNITVTTPGDTQFKGLLLYIKNSKDVHVGQWINVPDGFQTLDDDCKAWGLAKTTLCHSNPALKTTMSFSWVAPTSGQGDLQLRGVVVQEQTDWKRFNVITLNGPGEATGLSTTSISNATSNSGADLSSPETSYMAVSMFAAGSLVSFFF